MKFGFCTNINFMNVDDDGKSRLMFDAIAKSGFDYLETHISDIAEFDKIKYKHFKKELEDNNIEVKAGLLLFPRNMPLVSDDMDITQIKNHADQALGIAADLNTEVVVFGNGGGRRVREYMSRDTAYDRIQQIMAAVDPIAGKHGVKVAVEPLCLKETNMINSVQDAVKLVNSVSAVNIGAVCDWYHVRADGRTLDDMTANADKIFHLHIAYPGVRTMPMPTDDLSEYADFVKAVKQIGYDNKISIEGSVGGDITVERFKDSLNVLKHLFGSGENGKF